MRTARIATQRIVDPDIGVLLRQRESARPSLPSPSDCLHSTSKTCAVDMAVSNSVIFAELFRAGNRALRMSGYRVLSPGS